MSAPPLSTLGIDLGTTYTVCAYFDAQSADTKLLPIEQPWTGWDQENFRKSNQLASSVFLFHPNDGPTPYAFVGQYCNEIRTYPADEPFRLLKSIKRQMGTGWKMKFRNHIWTPPMVSGLILKAVEGSARMFFGREVEGVVVTVPAAFSTEQRRETVAAATLAGFDTSRLRLLDEPIAALLSHIVQHPESFVSTEKRYLAMLDIGGGTFDVSIIESYVEGDELIVDAIASSRYNEVAGDDFDLSLAALILDKMPGGAIYFDSLEPHEQRSFSWRLINEAERIKRELSILASRKSKLERMKTPPEVPYRLDGLPKDRRLAGTMTFDELTVALEPFFFLDSGNIDANLYYPTVYKPILEAFAAAGKVLGVTDFTEELIDDVFCTGGSSHLYHFQVQIAKFFGKQPKIIDPEFAVARGAAYFEPILSNTIVIGKRGLEVVFRRRLFDGVYLRDETGRIIEVISPNIIIPCEQRPIDIGLIMPRTDFRLSIEVFIGRGAQDSLMFSCPKQEIQFNTMIPANTRIELGYTITVDNQIRLSFLAGSSQGWLRIIDDYNLRLDSLELPPVNRLT